MFTVHRIKFFLAALAYVSFIKVASASTIHVGMGFPFSSLVAAADVASPGDTILVHEGIYGGGVYLENLQGTSSQWIYLHAAPGEEVVFEGSTNAWQLTDAAYLHIKGFIFRHQTGNGLNFDDGGSYETPAHHVIFEECIFRDMSASGNNDLLKLSGLDSFEIRRCLFLNGAAGGSGIDMVGCHHGQIIQNRFENLGSNSIQAKGGTSDIRIEANFFHNGGARALNLGGSTGLEFFRPIDAGYEAADLKVYSNIFIGSEAAVAFVGSINCEVINNTIYLPTKWVMRILQETVDETRFPPCGYNTFRNNIIYIDNRVSVEVNIGPNTAPETFTFSNNLWYHSQDASWTGPDLPAPDLNSIIGQDPLFEDASDENFDIDDMSPALASGLNVPDPQLDFSGEPFLNPRSIGAHEGQMMTGINESFEKLYACLIYPNPCDDKLTISNIDQEVSELNIALATTQGIVMLRERVQKYGNIVQISTSHLPAGSYILTLESGESMHHTIFQIIR